MKQKHLVNGIIVAILVTFFGGIAAAIYFGNPLWLLFPLAAIVFVYGG